MATEIQLTRVMISRNEYGQAKGRLTGAVEFKGPHGKVELPLDEEMSREVVRLCSEGILRVSRQVAEEMTADVLEQSLSLPAA